MKEKNIITKEQKENILKILFSAHTPFTVDICMAEYLNFIIRWRIDKYSITYHISLHECHQYIPYEELYIKDSNEVDIIYLWEDPFDSKKEFVEKQLLIINADENYKNSLVNNFQNAIKPNGFDQLLDENE